VNRIAFRPVVPAPGRRPARAAAVYLLVSALLLAAYAAVAVLLWVNRDFADDGPLSYARPGVALPVAERTALGSVEDRCRVVGRFDSDTKYALKVVAADGYWACYQVKPDGAVWKAVVVDRSGLRAPDRVAKDLGAWRWIGTVKTPTELVLGGLALAALLALHFAYARRPRPGPPVPARWWQTGVASGVLGALGLLPLTLPFRRRESRARRMRLFYLFVLGWSAFLVVVFLADSRGDRLTLGTLGMLLAGILFGWLGGRALLRPPGWGRPDSVAPGYAVPPAYAGQPAYAGPPAYPVAFPGPAPVPPRPAPAPPPAPPPPALSARVRKPGDLPTFAQVGGMDGLKAELADTIGLLLAFAGEADQYRIAFNGILLHGPPGVGKTFVARATAGEFGLNFLHVSTGDLVSKYVGESARNLRAVFAEAARAVPCVLFFDEFDSIAERREDGVNDESKRVVAQLLQSLEEWRPVRDLVVMAATNHLDRLDPAVVRAGRFDRHVRVDLPDLAARRAILAAQLADRPTADVDLDDLARRTAGRTPATIGRVVEAAALAAFRRHTESGRVTPITGAELRTALAGLGGTDRPTVEDWSWDRLVLDPTTKAELRQVQDLVTDPDRAAAYGVQVPSGLLLAGPPGTGKTTIARVFAAQAGCSFYPTSAADLTSKWVGESEASVVRLFARARDNAPSIVFIDEIDAIAGTRSESGSSVLDRTLTQLLTEIDGMTEQRGVFVMAATNRPDMLDPALLRGGRLSRTVTVPLPDRAARRELLGLFAASMPLRDVDLGAVADRTDGFSGADLEALCQQAALRAMLTASGAPVVTPAAFAEALADRRRARAEDEPEHQPETGQYL
jgi:transitional endoplasmic reticulum ATPase